jgi:hypothetical protein
MKDEEIKIDYDAFVRHIPLVEKGDTINLTHEIAFFSGISTNQFRLDLTFRKQDPKDKRNIYEILSCITSILPDKTERVESRKGLVMEIALK